MLVRLFVLSIFYYGEAALFQKLLELGPDLQIMVVSKITVEPGIVSKVVGVCSPHQ